jgi:transposase InsO family protein
MLKGFMYLIAIMDWATRKVLSWRLSNTLDTRFCVDALKETDSQKLKNHNAKAQRRKGNMLK